MCCVTVPTTSPPVTVVCSGVLATAMTVKIAPIPVRLGAALGQHDVVLPQLLITRDITRVVVHLTTLLQQQPQSQMPSQAYTNYAYAMSPPYVNFLF